MPEFTNYALNEILQTITTTSPNLSIDGSTHRLSPQNRHCMCLDCGYEWVAAMEEWATRAYCGKCHHLVDVAAQQLVLGPDW